MADRYYISLRDILDIQDLPFDLFDPGDESFLDRVEYVNSDVFSSQTSYSVSLSLRVREALQVSLAFLPGFRLLIGQSDPENGLVTVDFSAQAGSLLSEENNDIEETESEGEALASSVSPLLDRLSLSIQGDLFSLLLPRELLSPIEFQRNDQGQMTGYYRLDDELTIDLGASLVSCEYNGEDWHFDISLFDAEHAGLHLPPVIIGDTGIILEAESLQLNFSEQNLAEEDRENRKGLYLAQGNLYIPALFNGAISFQDFSIGAGGVTGRVERTFALLFDEDQRTFEGDLATEIFGFAGGISAIELAFNQNVLTTADIRGRILLPFFDAAIDIELGFDLDGNISVFLAELDKKVTLGSVGTVTLHSLGVEHGASGVFIRIGGQLKLGSQNAEGNSNSNSIINQFDWPLIDISLLIDPDGDVHIEGGWLDLPQQFSLDFHGFQLELTKIGFGKTDDGGKWVGFSGGINLLDGVQAGASVEGLRIVWSADDAEPRISLDGVGVEFEIPEVLRFKGAVAYSDEGDDHKFSGALKVDLIALDLQVDSQVVFGIRDSEKYMAIYLGLELPAGIPLWSTGLALYGMQGLYAQQMEPHKKLEEEWYQGWYQQPPTGVTELEKWSFQREDADEDEAPPVRMGLGAGITLGTVADNGYAFSGKLLLLLFLFPGPVVLIEGKASILQERADLDEEPPLRALAVLDNRVGTFQVGLSAQYQYWLQGELIDIGGYTEAFFDLADATNWHLYLGERTPRERRVRAEIFRLFGAEAYFMLDARRLALGAWVGFKEQWRFRPLRVALEAWMEGNAALSLKPAHFSGRLWLHGGAELSAFGVRIWAAVDTILSAQVFQPFFLAGDFSVRIGLPWPLDDLSASIGLTWGDARSPAPPLPLPLKEVAIEHFLSSVSWPLPRDQALPDNRSYLEPNQEGEAGFISTHREVALDAPPLDLPIVPLDARPHLTFSYPIFDAAGIDNPPLEGRVQFEQIGNPESGDPQGPAQFSHTLTAIDLEKYATDPDQETSVWRPVARTGAGPFPEGIRKLYGSWAPVPKLPGGEAVEGSDLPVGNTKLWLWSRNPFDYTRHGGRAWDTWFERSHDHYPCPPPVEPLEVCYNFERLEPETELQVQTSTPLQPESEQSVNRRRWTHPDNAKLVFVWEPPPVSRAIAGPVQTTIIPQPQIDPAHFDPAIESVSGEEGLFFTRALCFPERRLEADIQPTHIGIGLPEPTQRVEICLYSHTGGQLGAVDGETELSQVVPAGELVHLEFVGEEILDLSITAEGAVCVYEICYSLPDHAAGVRLDGMLEHFRDQLSHWADEGAVLEPYTTYRLKIVTDVNIRTTLDENEFPDGDLIEYAYFRTEGPPGLTGLSIPLGTPANVPSTGSCWWIKHGPE